MSAQPIASAPPRAAFFVQKQRLSAAAIASGALVGLALAMILGPRAIEVMAGDDPGIHDFFIRQAPARANAHFIRPSAPPPAVYSYAPAQLTSGPTLQAINRAAPAAKKRKVASAEPHVAKAPYSAFGSRAVCVRLCDGFHFPLGAVEGRGSAEAQQGMCESLCPGAPARLFVIPSGSEKIEDAVSRDGRKYSALPVAFRHAATRDRTCSCRRAGDEDTSPVMSLFDDRTLRRGDGVMTDKGVRVFRGATRWPLRKRDFVTLKQLKLDREARSALSSLEKAKASLPGRRQNSVETFARVPAYSPRAALEKPIRLVGPPGLPTSLR